MAFEQNFGLLTQMVTEEQSHLTQQFELWQQLIDRNATFRERLEHTRFEEYVNKAKQIQKIFQSSLKME